MLHLDSRAAVQRKRYKILTVYKMHICAQTTSKYTKTNMTKSVPRPKNKCKGDLARDAQSRTCIDIQNNVDARYRFGIKYTMQLDAAEPGCI